ncbi:MAG: hypothetical protein Q4B69_05240 [Slackia sp.]|nr:hypothetical protein [Slackia sp.]
MKGFGMAFSRNDVSVSDSSSDRRRPLGGFTEAFKAEIAKGKRSAARKTALIAPVPVCLIGLMSSGIVTGGLGPGGVGFNTYGWCYWYTLLLPVAIALISAGVAGIDARGKFHGVMSAPVDLRAVWQAKTAYVLVLVACANAVVALCSIVVHLLGGSAVGPGASLVMTLLLTASSIWMVQAGLFLTMRLKTLAGIALPLIAQLALGIALYGSDLWWLVPPAAAMRLCSPFAGVAPSGVPLAAHEAYGVIDIGWFAALAVCVLVGCMLVVAGSAWFRNWEAR